MLIRIFIILIGSLLLQYCSNKNNMHITDLKTGKSEYYINSDAERCFVIWGGGDKVFLKLLTERFKITFDEIESYGGGLNYRVIVSKDSIRFKTYGSEQVHKYKVKQIS
ncbi:hypothetical protein, partial [Leptospira ilyithenensis]